MVKFQSIVANGGKYNLGNAKAGILFVYKPDTGLSAILIIYNEGSAIGVLKAGSGTWSIKKENDCIIVSNEYYSYSIGYYFYL